MEYKSVKLFHLQLLLLAKVVHPESYWSEDYDIGKVQLEWVHSAFFSIRSFFDR